MGQPWCAELKIDIMEKDEITNMFYAKQEA